MYINNNNKNSIENKNGEQNHLILIDSNNSFSNKNSFSLSLNPINNNDNKFYKLYSNNYSFHKNDSNNNKKFSNTIYKKNVSSKIFKPNNQNYYKHYSLNKFKSNIEIKQVINQFKFNKENVKKTLNSKSKTKVFPKNNENSLEKKNKSIQFSKIHNKNSNPLVYIQDKYQFNIDNNLLRTSNSIINQKYIKVNNRQKRNSLKLKVSSNKDENIIYKDILSNMRNNSENTNIKYESIQNLPKNPKNEEKQKKCFLCCFPFCVK
jgi:hypothetical protein